MKKPLILLLPFLLSACASPTSEPRSQSTTNESELLKASKIELDYVLGHVKRKLVLQALNGSVSGKNFHERQMLQEVQVTAPHYESYWRKISEYADRHPAKDPDLGTACKNIYLITLETAQGSRKIEGCRTHTADDSSLSHIIREGEFLMTRRSPSSVIAPPK